MDHRQLSMVADKFQWVFSESLRNACGTDAKFCRRVRTITPFRLGLALTATCASQRVETLADFYRGFNALFDTTITYKAFYNQLAKARFATFMGTMASRLIGDRGAEPGPDHVPLPRLPTLQSPATVQEVLAARLDRLPPTEKALLQTLAVMGHAVPWRLLTQVVGQPEEALSQSLETLQVAEFLYE